jgi:hypothetical protein
MISLTRDVTIAPKAAPIITATARSTTFPRRRKFFKSFNISYICPFIIILYRP